MKKSIIDRIERKLIIKNTAFVKQGTPRKKIKGIDVDLLFKGRNSLVEVESQKDKIFSSFDSSTSVLIKISINSPNPYPASTSKEMLGTLIDCLRQRGVKDICIGDSSGLVHLPTRKVMKAAGLSAFKEKNIRVSVFDYGGWARIPVNGTYFKELILSSSIYNYDRIINLSNLKSHWSAGFTFSTKSLVGLMHPAQRRTLHKDHLQEKIAEISLAVEPDINIVDGRKIFIDGGPDSGTVADANTIIINSDLLKADLDSYKILFAHRQKNGIKGLDKDPFSNRFFGHFRKIRGNKA